MKTNVHFKIETERLDGVSIDIPEPGRDKNNQWTIWMSQIRDMFDLSILGLSRREPTGRLLNSPLGWTFLS